MTSNAASHHESAAFLLRGLQMSPDTAIALAQAEELIASAIRLISAHAGEHVAIAIGTQLAWRTTLGALRQSARFMWRIPRLSIERNCALCY